MKHKLSLLLSLLAVSALPVMADALSGYCGRKIDVNADSTNLQWVVDLQQHTLTITGSGPMKDYDNDNKAPWYPWRNDIYSLSFPDGMTTVGNRSMYDLYNLTTINWGGNTVERIGSDAFYNCRLLTQVVLPTSVIRIEGQAFQYCYALQSVKMGDLVEFIGWGAFRYCNELVSVDMGESPVVLDGTAFQNDYSLVNLTFNQVISIGYHAFEACRSLVSLHLPASLTYVESGSFRSCNGLDTITVDPNNTLYDSRNDCNAIISTADNTLIFGCCRTVIPNDILYIADEAFYDCNRLSSIVLPEGLLSVGSHAFYSCTQLSSINFPESIQSVGCGVFRNCSNLTTPICNSICFAYMPPSYLGSYSLPATTEMIACEAFYDCSGVTAISIPSSVYDIGSYAFFRCSSLTQIDLPERLKTISDYLFQYCSSLSSIVIPDSVTSINYRAFSYCSSLTSITFPASLINVGGDVLQGCTSLSSIFWNIRTFHDIGKNSTWDDPLYAVRSQITSFTFGDSVQIIPNNLCYDMIKLTSISLGCNITSIGTAFDGCNNIKMIHWNLRTCTEPKIYTQAPFYSLRDSITTITFGDSVRMIPNYLCHSMKRLRQLHIPELVSHIGAFTFRFVAALDSISVDEYNLYYDSRNHCNALIDSRTNILMLGCYKTEIPEDIHRIGDCAFRNVRRLRSVTLSDNVTHVGKEAFNGCRDLKQLSMANTIDTIEDYAFQACDSLQQLTLPENLEFIGLRAFAQCTGLDVIYSDAQTPPTIDETSFSATTCPIYVPCAQITNYRSAPIWQDFGSRLTGEAVYTFTVKPNDFAYGVVTVVQQPDCEHNGIVEAEASRGYEFVAWQNEAGTQLSTETHYEFTLEEDLNLIAVFRRVTEGVENVWAEGKAVWYDLMGHRVDEPTHGVYIVQTGSQTRKVVIP